MFRMVEDNLGRAVDDDGVLDTGRHVFQKQDVLCGQRDASLLFTEGTVQVGDEVSEFLVLQSSSASSMISSLANPWRFLIYPRSFAG